MLIIDHRKQIEQSLIQNIQYNLKWHRTKSDLHLTKKFTKKKKTVGNVSPIEFWVKLCVGCVCVCVEESGEEKFNVTEINNAKCNSSIQY